MDSNHRCIVLETSRLPLSYSHVEIGGASDNRNPVYSVQASRPTTERTPHKIWLSFQPVRARRVRRATTRFRSENRTIEPVPPNWMLEMDSNHHSRFQRAVCYRLHHQAIKWRKMGESNSLTLAGSTVFKTVRHHCQLPSEMVADAGIEPARRTNLVLRVYKAQPHACAVGNKMVFHQGFEP